ANALPPSPDPESLTVVLTYAGWAQLPNHGDSHELRGTVAKANYSGSATNTLVITPAEALVALADLTQVYDGTGKAATVTTDPENLTVVLSYDGSAELPINAGSYEVVGTIAEANYTGSATNTLVITQAEAL